MKFLLDTNACITLLNGASQSLVERVREHHPVLTANLREFRRVVALRVENWQS